MGHGQFVAMGFFAGKVQCIDAAEVFAAVSALRHCLPPIQIHTDSAFLADGWVNGPEWCVAARRVHADIWRLFWDAVSDVGQEHVAVIKVKGHATEADVFAGRATPMDKWGNKLADEQARLGAKCHPVDTHAEQRIQAAMVATKTAASWIGRGLSIAASAGALPPKVTEQEKKQRRAGSSDEQPAWHLEVIKDDTWRWQKKLGQIHATHSLWRIGMVAFCSRCGSYAEHAVRDLAKPCPGSVASVAKGRQIELARNGRHPVSGTRLGTPTPVRSSQAAERD